MNTRQIPGRDKIGSLAPDKYTEFSGTEIVAENCVKAKTRDLVTEGKTYQNLIDVESEIIVEGTGTFIFKAIQTTLVKPNTVYTLHCNIIPVQLSSNGFKPSIHVYLDKSTFMGKLEQGEIFKFTTSADTKIIEFRLFVNGSTGSTTNCKAIFSNLFLLEGDYTNTNLPSSITGIESVAEKENNVLSLKVNDVVSNISLPIPLRSLPNEICDTIEGDKLVQRVGEVVLDGTEDLKFQSYNTNENGLLNVYIYVSDIVLKSVLEQKLLCSKYKVQRTAIANTTAEGILANQEGKIYLRLSKDHATNIAEAKEYIKNNPFTVYYELAKPIVHNLTIPPLATVKGTNIITTTNNIKPKLNIKLKIK